MARCLPSNDTFKHERKARQLNENEGTKAKMTNLYDEVKTIYNRTKTLEGEAYDKAVDEEIELISKKIEEFAQKGKPSYDHELYGSLRNANEYIRKYYAKQGFNVRVIDCRIFKSIDSDIPISVIIEWDN